MWYNSYSTTGNKSQSCFVLPLSFDTALELTIIVISSSIIVYFCVFVSMVIL